MARGELLAISPASFQITQLFEPQKKFFYVITQQAIQRDLDATQMRPRCKVVTTRKTNKKTNRNPNNHQRPEEVHFFRPQVGGPPKQPKQPGPVSHKAYRHNLSLEAASRKSRDLAKEKLARGKLARGKLARGKLARGKLNCGFRRRSYSYLCLATLSANEGSTQKSTL